MSVNQDSISNQGEFHSRVPPSEPLTTKGHAPGVKVGNDAAPEFHAETLPAGTAPKSQTFTPQTQSEIPGQAMNPNISKESWTSASDTLGGVTSADVHTGLGHPGSRQTSSELHDGRKQKSGLAGVGADQSDTFRERGQDIDFPKGTKGKSGTLEERQNVPGAEEREPVRSEEVAAKRD